MFQKSTYVKALLIGILILFSANHLTGMRRESVLNSIEGDTNKVQILATLGGQSSYYDCAKPTNSSSNYEDTLCKKGAAEVYTFKRCLIASLCPGWNYVVFDPKGHAIYKYSYALPVFNLPSRN